MYKRYKVNNTFGIDCFSRFDKLYVQVFMHTVPWEEVVEESVCIDSLEANKEFKRLLNEYRGREASYVTCM